MSSGSPGERDYVLGTDDAELRRLGLQHRLWCAPAVALWERAGIGPGDTVLDVGCGPGHATVELAELVEASGRVVAVDTSSRFLEHLAGECARLGLTHVETRREGAEAMQVPPGSVDLAWARWVLCFVSDPGAVVAAVARALRPGGAFAVQDYCRYLGLTFAPRSRALERVIEATDASWRESGGDPDVCANLPGLMAEHGLQVREIEPLVRVARAGTMLWEWPRTFFGLYVPRLMQGGHLTAAEAEAFWHDFEARARDPNAFFVTPPMASVLAVKA